MADFGNGLLTASSVLGLLVISYKSAKALKARLDGELDEVIEQEQQSTTDNGEPDPVADDDEDVQPGHYSSDDDDDRDKPATVGQILGKSPGRKSLLGRQRRMSTLQRTELLLNTAERTSYLLKFWILLGILQLAVSLRIFYAVELRSLLILLAVLPAKTSAPIIEQGFAAVAVPLMESFVPAVWKSIRRQAYAVMDIVSPMYRRALSVTTLYASRYAPTEDLLSVERALGREQALIAQVRKSRRLAMLQAEGATGAAAVAAADSMLHDGDYLDDDESMFAGLKNGGGFSGNGQGQAGPGAEPATPAGLVPGRQSDLWGMETPGRPVLSSAALAAAAMFPSSSGSPTSRSGNGSPPNSARGSGAAGGASAAGVAAGNGGKGSSASGDVRKRPVSLPIGSGRS